VDRSRRPDVLLTGEYCAKQGDRGRIGLWRLRDLDPEGRASPRRRRSIPATAQGPARVACAGRHRVAWHVLVHPQRRGPQGRAGQAGQAGETRYSTFGFSDQANLDDGGMWPTAYALTELRAADEAAVGALVKQAASSGP